LGGSYGSDGGYSDIDPVYLPNGKIMFASTRCQRSVLCFPASVTALHVMDSDGKNIECISQGQVNENSLCVLDDGRVQMQEVKSGSSMGSGNDLALRFGLGTAQPVSLTVRWPDGTIENLDTVPTGTEIAWSYP